MPSPTQRLELEVSYVIVKAARSQWPGASLAAIAYARQRVDTGGECIYDPELAGISR
jgi:hypothetical protein